MQQPLLRINVVQEFPYDGGTADLKALAFGDDGHEYALKRLEDAPLLPITEWVSYHLCRSVGIQTPDFDVLWRVAGDPAFGSRWEHHAVQLGTPTPLRLLQLFQPHRSQIEPIYAVDAFLPNNDRHFNNILFRDSAVGLLPLAYDFSRAWIMSGLPAGDMASMMTSHCKTTLCWAYLKQQYGYQPATATLDAICALPADWLQNVIDAAPRQWLNFEVQATLDAWVNGRQKRTVQAGALL